MISPCCLFIFNLIDCEADVRDSTSLRHEKQHDDDDEESEKQKKKEKVSNWNFAIIPATRRIFASNSRFINFSSPPAPALPVLYLYHLFIFIAKLLNIVILYRYRAIIFVVIFPPSFPSTSLSSFLRAECIVCWAIKHNKHQSFEIDTRMISNVPHTLLRFRESLGEASQLSPTHTRDALSSSTFHPDGEQKA